MGDVQRGFVYSDQSRARRRAKRVMPIKLQVTKKDAESKEPADYLFEQGRITIGRGSSNDLTLPDQKISKKHAEIRSKDGEYVLLDRESKNNTYVDGQRIGETEPYLLQSGDIFRVGDFLIEFAPLFMPSSEQTAFAEVDEAENPFEKHAHQLAVALEGLAQTYKFAPSEERDDEFAAAVQNRVDSEEVDRKTLERILSTLTPASSADGQPQGTTDGESPSPQVGADDDAVDAVLGTLLKSVLRMSQIPTYFWREFTGKTVAPSSEAEFLQEADVEDLREHLLDDTVTVEERKSRLENLTDAVDSLVAHNMAMLAGYKKAVMAGSKELLQRVNPIDAVEEAEEGGMMNNFFGSGTKSELEKLDEDWRALFHEEWGQLESDLFRPTYIEAYVDRMADTWDVDKAELLADES